MDVRYINPFINSISNVFQKMCGLHVTSGKPELKKDGKPESDVSAVIGFSGDAAGSLVLHFDFACAANVTKAFAGTDIIPEHADYSDALGELANMVAGGAKAQFDGLRINISLPNVIIGPKHSVSASKTVPRILVPCKTETGSFYLEVGMVVSGINVGSSSRETAGERA